MSNSIPDPYQEASWKYVDEQVNKRFKKTVNNDLPDSGKPVEGEEVVLRAPREKRKYKSYNENNILKKYPVLLAFIALALAGFFFILLTLLFRI